MELKKEEVIEGRAIYMLYVTFNHRRDSLCQKIL